MANEDEIIDLTSSYYIPSTPRLNSNNDDCTEVINLVDDSFETINITDNVKKTAKKSSVESEKRSQKAYETTKRKKVMKSGICSICFDELGLNPLASTRCGHVFCHDCLEQALKINKQCPTCRRVLKGPSSYHPLYLDYINVDITEY